MNVYDNFGIMLMKWKRSGYDGKNVLVINGVGKRIGNILFVLLGRVFWFRILYGLS